MAYHTYDGVIRKITEDLYDETLIDDRIEDVTTDVIAWVNSAVRTTVDFTEEELTGDDDIIRLASDCYAAFRIMSEMLEGHDVDSKSLALVRFDEAKEYIRMWCAVNGVIPAFDEDFTSGDSTSSEVQTDYGYAGGTDEVCVSGG